MQSSQPPKQCQLQPLLSKKNLDSKTFTPGEIKFSDPISNHAAWAFQHIYSKPYPQHAEITPFLDHRLSQIEKGKIARFCHGIQHVTRVAIYIPVLANLYRRYGDKEALELTPDDIKHLQIAALFHDSAREGEEKDYWDTESGLFLYYYLTRVLNIPDIKKAKHIAEAAANKDAGHPELKKNSIQFAEDKNEAMLCHFLEKITKKNIYQKLIHDADCLDIIRARDAFDAKYLDFYQDIAQHNPQAFDEMAQLITEVRSVIASQGDARRNTQFAIKELFECLAAYSEIEKNITQADLCILPILYANNSLLSTRQLKQPLLDTTPYDKTKPLDELNLKAALREGKVLARSITAPSTHREKVTREAETSARVEFRKMHRRLGIPTRTLKANRTKKNGNPNRSFSLIGWGGKTYSDVGYLVVNPIISQINHISVIDIDSGIKKKKLTYTLQSDEAQIKLAALTKQLKMGGSYRWHRSGTYSSHTEILYCATQADAIFYTPDLTFHTERNTFEESPNTRYLQALFLQGEAECFIHKKIPIFEYSGMHNSVKQIPEYKPQDLIKMWVDMCMHYYKKELLNIHYSQFNIHLPLAKLKHQSMYDCVAELNSSFSPADMHYESTLRTQIDTAIETARYKLLAEHIAFLKKKIVDEKLSVFDLQVYNILIHSPELRESLHDAISTEISQKIQTDDFFENINSTNKCPSDDDLVLKIFNLATQMKLEQSAIISKYALTIAKSKIQEILTTKIFCTPEPKPHPHGYYEIYELIRYLKKFDLLDTCYDVVKEIISTLHNIFMNETLRSNYSSSFYKYAQLIKYIDTEGFLDEHEIEKVKKVLATYSNNYAFGTVVNLDYGAEECLFLANTCKLPKDEIKKMYLSWAQHCKSKHDLWSNLAAASLLSDIEIANMNILNIYAVHYDEIDKVHRVSIRCYLDTLYFLKGFLPNNTYTEDHLSAMNDRLMQVTNELVKYLPSRSTESAIRILAEEILVLLKTDYPLSVPDVMVKLLIETSNKIPKSKIPISTLNTVEKIESLLEIPIFTADKLKSALGTGSLFKTSPVIEAKTDVPCYLNAL